MKKFAILLVSVVLAACSSTATKEESKPVGCGVKDFSYGVGQTEGAAGTSYTPLVLTNISTRDCVIETLTTAQPISGGDLTGLPSRQNGVPNSAATLTLKAGEKASVLYAVATASNYPADECVVTPSDGVRVTVSTGQSKFSTDFAMPTYDVCTKLSSTLISSFVPGAEG